MERKSPEAFRTISEVAEWLGTPTHVLRFWESRFAQVKPVKRAGGRRYYRPSDMMLLGGIKRLLHEEGMTIRGVQKLLREKGVKHVASLSPPLEPDLVLTIEATTRGGEDAREAPFAEVEEQIAERPPATVVDIETARGGRDAGERGEDRGDGSDEEEAPASAPYPFARPRAPFAKPPALQDEARSQPETAAPPQGEPAGATPPQPEESETLPDTAAPAGEEQGGEQPPSTPESSAPEPSAPEPFSPEPAASEAAAAEPAGGEESPGARETAQAPMRRDEPARRPAAARPALADPMAFDAVMDALREGARPDPAAIAPILSRLEALRASFEASSAPAAKGPES
ncbi:MerR HTH family regulatory protein [Meinhardsimonia xiamenensis]|jgi:DNA-binding transcriptional MerR regulator|uniref:MerR HTH family regulatory protein n=1 Tax=Meinhardsimonia xiamenensis TaxID=990712 RepID=A0A1G9BDE9_9RHOB|nr:MerR family transcriptional regulator [Meinhardsimonia xiamenensis]PRX35021.1 MerR-like DNA binding protein [Meinhardsimonia xiamenensis]SDK37497.1 MerR HTH family regulatory protein [Meinhardsimonia xiamenensis]